MLDSKEERENLLMKLTVAFEIGLVVLCAAVSIFLISLLYV
ncbi:TPA: hypothetical protein ACKP9V_004313 [Pseudomonas aeruginosa]